MRSEKEIRRKLKEKNKKFTIACKKWLGAQVLYDAGFISALEWVLKEEEE